MKNRNRVNTLAASLLALTALNTVEADNVRILATDFRNSGGDSWSVKVTLKHGDTGWDHYADNWRIVDDEGNILGNRVLLHPHVNGQPFTRGLGDVKVPDGITSVYIETYCKLQRNRHEHLANKPEAVGEKST